MFSPEIVGSDAFIEMPVSSQLLYFHLSMRADDDGFVNPQIIMRMIGVNNDDLKVIIAKRFVLPFENGVIVIKHWRINNFIRKDRYNETLYLDQKRQLRVKENGVYTTDKLQGKPIGKVPWKSDQEKRLTSGQPTDNAVGDVGKVRLGKVRLGKINTADFDNFWNAYPRKTGKKPAQKTWERLNPDATLIQKISEALVKHKESEQWVKDNGIFIPYPATWLNQERWNDEVIKAIPKKKKPYYNGMPIVEIFGKRYCLKNGEKLEFAGKEKDITYQ